MIYKIHERIVGRNMRDERTIKLLYVLGGSVNGICALCSKSAKLKDSHFMPKAIYRSISKGFPEHGQNIVLINGSNKSAAYSDKQAKKHLLCESCELKFSKNGEDKVISLMSRTTGFKLATKIKKFRIFANENDEKWFFPPDKEIAYYFMYFAVSIAWRLSATDWSGFGIPDTKGSIRTDSMISFSDFLLGKSKTSANTYLAVYVDNEMTSTPVMGFPTIKNHAGFQHIVFNIPGIKFSLLTGRDPGEGIEETFSINDTKVYFVSRSLKSHPDFRYMVDYLKNQAVAKGRLFKERSKNV